MILLTRRLEDSIRVSELLDSEKLSNVIEPLFHTQKIDFEDDLDLYDSVFISSFSAIESFTQFNKMQRFFVIGERTASFVRERGGKKILVVEKNASRLAMKSLNFLSQKNKIIYLRGKDISFDLKGFMSEHNFNLHEITTYQLIRKNYLSSHTKLLLQQNQIKQVILFSQRTSDHFISLLQRMSEKAILNLVFIVPSNVAIGIKDARIKHFEPSNLEGLVKLLRNEKEETC
ncbi:MAG: uroporphyrinogen-III synthase [Rickettsiales bacterium]